MAALFESITDPKEREKKRKKYPILKVYVLCYPVELPLGHMSSFKFKFLLIRNKYILRIYFLCCAGHILVLRSHRWFLGNPHLEHFDCHKKI